MDRGKQLGFSLRAFGKTCQVRSWETTWSDAHFVLISDAFTCSKIHRWAFINVYIQVTTTLVKVLNISNPLGSALIPVPRCRHSLLLHWSDFFGGSCITMTIKLLIPALELHVSGISLILSFYIWLLSHNITQPCCFSISNLPIFIAV